MIRIQCVGRPEEVKVYARSVKHVLKEIDCPALQLYRGEGYWYFQYDTLDQGGVYETESVASVNLNHLSLATWVEIGKRFADECKAKEIDQKEDEDERRK